MNINRLRGRLGRPVTVTDVLSQGPRAWVVWVMAFVVFLAIWHLASSDEWIVNTSQEALAPYVTIFSERPSVWKNQDLPPVEISSLSESNCQYVLDQATKRFSRWKPQQRMACSFNISIGEWTYDIRLCIHWFPRDGATWDDHNCRFLTPAHHQQLNVKGLSVIADPYDKQRSGALQS